MNGRISSVAASAQRLGLSLAANYPAKVISLVCDGALSSEFGPYGTWEGSEQEFQLHIARQLEKMHNTPEATYPSVDALVETSRRSFEAIGWWNENVEVMERYGVIQLDDGKLRQSLPEIRPGRLYAALLPLSPRRLLSQSALPIVDASG